MCKWSIQMLKWYDNSFQSLGQIFDFYHLLGGGGGRIPYGVISRYFKNDFPRIHTVPSIKNKNKYSTLVIIKGYYLQYT